MIDFHTHLGGVKSWHKNLKGLLFVSEKDLLSYMADVGIDKAVVLPTPYVNSELGEYIYSAERILRICRFREELLPFFCLDPLKIEEAEKLSILEDCISKGAVGYGEHKVRLPIDHPGSLKIYEACGELGLPILMHVDELHNYGFEKTFPELADKYSKTIFVMHGPGWWRHISADPGSEPYPKGRVQPHGLVDKLLKNENVYADISATSGLNALQRDKEYAKKFLEKHRFKILYGTDFPCIDSEGGQYGVDRLHLDLLESLGLSEKTLRYITFRNAERLLRIS
jgi:predicted TIM-barrel fold metal-dependent hydrolase